MIYYHDQTVAIGELALFCICFIIDASFIDFVVVASLTWIEYYTIDYGSELSEPKSLSRPLALNVCVCVSFLLVPPIRENSLINCVNVDVIVIVKYAY